MEDFRRKQFYIDRIFQKKFMVMFLLLSLTGAVGNILYMLIYLKEEISDSLYRHRFIISNINEVLVDNVFEFNIVLLAAATLIALILYFIVRRRIQLFVVRLEAALQSRMSYGLCNAFESDLPVEFQDVNNALVQFFNEIDKRIHNEKETIALLREYMQSPEDVTRQEILDKLQTCT